MTNRLADLMDILENAGISILGKDLAAAVGAAPQQITNWKKGVKEPGIKYIEKMCDFFSVEPSFLSGHPIIMQVYDPFVNDVIPGELLKVTYIGEFTTVYTLVGGDGQLMTMIMHKGMQYIPETPSNLFICTPDAIRSVNWVDNQRKLYKAE